MGRKCCVPNCRGNYVEAEKVSVFTFPKDESRKKLWLGKIPRDNFVPSNQSAVCEKHFIHDFIVRVDSVTRPDGSVLTVPRTKPKLTDDAYPSIFPNCPSYLSEKTPLKRKKPEDRRHEIEQRDANSFVEWLEADKIASFAQFSEKFSCHVDTTKWLYRLHDDSEPSSRHLSFYCLDDGAPKLISTIKVFNDLHVEICTSKAGHIPSNGLYWILDSCSPPTLKTWSQFDTMLSHFSSDTSGLENSDFNKKINILTESLEDMCALEIEKDESVESKPVDKISFLIEQIKLSMSPLKRYSCSTLLWAVKVYAGAPRIYDVIRSTFLTLPHPSYIRKITSVFTIRSGLETSIHDTYLKQKCDALTERERQVILMLDEIHVSQNISYKEGKLEGSAINCPITEASTAQVFMISSILCKSKDVVAILPVRNVNAAWLCGAIKDVLKKLHTCGFSVVCVISDNNRINRNAFESIAGGTLQTSIIHPIDSTQRLFFLFDSVHLFKCIRNNWLMQKDAEKSFIFPCPDDHSDGNQPLKASFCHLEKLYNEEKSFTLKHAPSLNYKSLHPTTTEKQNVKLMLNIFNDKNVLALEHCEARWKIDTKGTRKFIKFCIRLWNILNVKHPFKGVRLRDDSCNAVSSLTNDSNYNTIQSALLWLERWRSLGLKSREGVLSNETMTALSHTLSAVLELCRYLLEEKQYRYVLLGKFQTDDLEFRFSQYRQMSGCNFHVSIQQVLEGEKKLKVLSVLRLISNSKGTLSLKDITVPLEETKVEIDSTSCDDEFLHFSSILSDCDNITISHEQLKALVFVAGYCIIRPLRLTQCASCKSDLSIDRLLQVEGTEETFSYISALDRGGLRWPSDYVISIITQVYKVFQFLIGSADNEKKFMLCGNQRVLVTRLLDRRLTDTNMYGRKCCECDKDHKDLISKFCKPAVNIFLNNYSKQLTDKAVVKKNDRKLKTFTKRI